MEGKGPADPIIIMALLSHEFGWTPSQIREQRYEDIMAYVDFIQKRRLLEKQYGSR
jgi:hypothetical protein